MSIGLCFAGLEKDFDSATGVDCAVSVGCCVAELVVAVEDGRIGC